MAAQTVPMSSHPKFCVTSRQAAGGPSSVASEPRTPIAATATSAGTAPYELVVSAQPVPPAPLPGPPPVVLREHERITQLKASGATFEELVAALRELSPQRGK